MIYRLAQPEYLYLLLLLPFLFFIFGKAGKRAALKFPSTRILGQVAALVKSKPGRFSKSLRWFALAFFIVALARPQGGNETTNITHSGVDILVAVDLSMSMWAHDFEIAGVYKDRLTVTKSVLKDFIEQRKHDRIGLIAFAAEPFLVSPLTLNHQWIEKRVNDLELGMIPDGTAIGSAIGSGVKRLKNLDGESRILILMTDGSNNRGRLDPKQAAEAAAAFGIKVYTIGVGQPGMVNYPQFNRDGTIRRASNGQPYFQRGRSDIDLETLQSISEITNARYYHATNLAQLQEIYKDIDQLEKTESTLNVRINYRELFFIPLAIGLFFLFLDIILHQTWLRRLP